MKRLLSNKWLILAAVLLCAAVLFRLLIVPLLVDEDALRTRLGTPLDELTEEYTPEQAAADDCLVEDAGNITAGKARWNWFRFKTALRIPSAIRICTFYSSGESRFADLTYNGRDFALYDPGRPANYARYLKFSKATNPCGGGFEGQNKYYLSTAANGSWDEYMNGILSASGDMPDYVVYILFTEWALP